MIHLSIRPERPEDAPTIAQIHLGAFHEHAYQAALVALHRRRPAFDPDLSIVATLDRRIVGHALFVPRSLRLLGQDVPAVNLASLAVQPAYHGCGVGTQLIREGHSLARDKGYTVSFLIGAPAYYTRFGYRTHAFGGSEVEVTSSIHLPASVVVRPVRAGDGPRLARLWRQAEAAVDFALIPDDIWWDWISPNPNIHASVFVRQSDVIGYIRSHVAHPWRPHVFLAEDADVAQGMAAYLAQGLEDERVLRNIVLPLHPASAVASAFPRPQTTAWSSALACSLAASCFDEYVAQVDAAARPPGRLTWPVEFEAVANRIGTVAWSAHAPAAVNDWAPAGTAVPESFFRRAWDAVAHIGERAGASAHRA